MNIKVIYGSESGNAESLAENTTKDLVAAGFSAVKYAVMGIGQSCFDQFCQTAKDFDAYLEKAKASRLLPVELCDDDFDDKYPTWIGNIISALKA